MATSTRAQDTRPHERGATSDIIPSTDEAVSTFSSPSSEEFEDEWWNDDELLVSIPKKVHEPSSRTTKWPTLDDFPPKVPSKSPRTSVRKPSRKNSVYKPTREKSRQRQKKQNAKAGIKVVTNFSKHQGPPSVPPQPPIPSGPARQPGCFVDLAAIQALDNKEPTNTQGFWKSLMGKQPESDAPLDNSQQEVEKDGEEPVVLASRSFGSRRERGLRPASLSLGDGLSPSDRPIVIGISVPSAKLDQHITSPQTAISESRTHTYQTRSPGSDVPETPTIVITPAQEPSMWSALDSTATAARSVVRNEDIPSHLPPVSQISPLASLAEARGIKRNNRTAQNSIDPNPMVMQRSRANSEGTMFEEDFSPIGTRQQRSGSESDAVKIASRTSDGTIAEDRRSKGWWNHILSPFLTRSNTLSFPKSSTEEHPPMPSLAIAAIEAERAREDRKWEKHFSPSTPTSSTTIASDAWWENRRTIDGMPKVADSENNTYRSEDYGTLPFMLSPGGLVDATNSSERSWANNVSHESTATGYQLTQPQGNSSLTGTNRVAPVTSVGGDSSSTTRNTPSNDQSVDISRPSPAIAPQPANPRDQTEMAESRLGANPDTPSQPPPYSPPRSNLRRYHALYPPGHSRNLQPPISPGPVSPGLQHVMASRGGIAMTDVPLTPPAPRRLINLNSGYPTMSSRQDYFDQDPVTLARNAEKARKIEAKRRRHEREDALAHKASGLWRGRGCVPSGGCYGRGGTEGRNRRRCWFGLIAGIIAIIILIAVLATQLHHSSSNIIIESQWLNLTVFPPMFTGVSTVAVPQNIVANSACVFPPTAWSCALPKELQSSVAPNQPNQPNFRIQIQWDNSSSANTTFGISKRETASGNAVSAGQYIKFIGLKARSVLSFLPSPPAPNVAEQAFLGNTTDGIMSKNKAGEPTPFYITFLSTTSTLVTRSELIERLGNSSSQFPNATSTIPSPSSNADGTAAPANLLPFPVQQPIRLYDRGLPSEHYGFYNYFDRSIFLKSTRALNSSIIDNGVVPDDENGGSTLSEAFVRCTWAQTRFLVQIWTRKGATAALFNSTIPGGSPTPVASATQNQNANNFARPGSFPYPITITTDRHGGDTLRKMIYCFQLNGREQLITSTAQQLEENRGSGGILINPAPSLFVNQSNPSLGGFDGGTSGCSCSWSNFINVVGVAH